MSFRNIAVVYFNDSASKFNKELHEFLRDNLERIIIRGNCRFRFEIVKSSQFSELKRKSITELPAVTINDKAHLGLPKIKKALINLAQTNQQPAALKSDEEMMHEAMLHQLSQGDNEKETNIDYAGRASAFQQSRGGDQSFKQPGPSFGGSRDDVDNNNTNRNGGYGGGANYGDNVVQSTGKINHDPSAQYHQPDSSTQFAMNQMAAESRGGGDARDNQMMMALLNNMGVD
jgi:hypothetical protein